MDDIGNHDEVKKDNESRVQETETTKFTITNINRKTNEGKLSS